MNEMNKFTFKGKIWRGAGFEDSFFYIDGEKIRSGRKGEIREVSYIIPTFADSHIHGGWGWSFQEGDFSPLEERLKKEGVFFAVPTFFNDELSNIERISASFSIYKKENSGSIFPFLRIEGPFISSSKKGAQDESFILAPKPRQVDRFLEIKEIKVFTFSPEVEGVEGLVLRAMEEGWIPSAGHSHASFSQFLKFYREGVRHITHFPNAVSPLHHREIGMTGAALFLTDLFLEVIADGIHSSLEFLKLLEKIKGPDFALISDLIPQAGKQVKKQTTRNFCIQGKRITRNDGVLAGGGTTVAEQVVLLKKAGWLPEALVRLACENTRRFFGIADPSLTDGAEATFLICDQDMVLQEIYYKGEKLEREKD